MNTKESYSPFLSLVKSTHKKNITPTHLKKSQPFPIFFKNTHPLVKKKVPQTPFPQKKKQLPPTPLK